MSEVLMPELLIEFFRERGVTLASEAWREVGFGKQAALFLSGGRSVVSEYVDGTRVIELGFEIRLRVPGESLKDRLDAIEFFRGIDGICRGSGEDFEVRSVSGVTKSAIYSSGDEEYRASYAVRYRER